MREDENGKRVQTNPHSTSDNHLSAVALRASGLRGVPSRIPLKRIIRSWVCRGWGLDADVLGLVRCPGFLAVSAVPSALRAV